MERKAKKKPNFILTSDWHLREDSPICFTGDWHQEQWKAVEFIRSLQAKYDCPVVHAGDLFHHWKPSPALISQALWFLPEQFYTIYGQHDLPQHNWELRSKSGLHTLEVAGKIKVLDVGHYGQVPSLLRSTLTRENGEKHEVIGAFNSSILVWHHMTYITPPYPGASEGQATGILKKYPQFTLIVTGDNHQSFYTEYEGRLLVNPGSLTRQDADQIDFKPRVYLWYAEDNTVEPVYLPISTGTISREHIEVKEQRNERIEAFIGRLNKSWEGEDSMELSFERNLEQFFKENQVRESVKQIVYKSIEGEES